MPVQSYSAENGRYKIFFDPTAPALQYRVDEGTGAKAISQDGGKTWQADTSSPSANVPLLPGLTNAVTSQMPAKTLEDTLATLAKAAPAAIGGPAMSGGFGDTGPFGFNGADTGGVPIPGGEFDPNTVYGNSPPAQGAPSGNPSIPKIITGLAPLAATVTNRLGNPSPSGSGVSSIDPALLSRLSQMLDLAQQRATSAQPVHDAAMRMAMRMAPTYGDSPRLNDAIANSTNPIPTGGPSAAMLAAYQKLAGR